MKRTRWAVLLAVIVLPACPAASPPSDGADTAASPAPSGGPSPIRQDREAPLRALPPCPEELPPPVTDAVPGLVLPEGSVITRVDDAGPLTDVEAVAPFNPIDVRAFYQYFMGMKALMVEDEVLEAEVLMDNRSHRFYVKALAFCPDASRLLIVVADEQAAGSVPTPAGGTATPSPPPPSP